MKRNTEVLNRILCITAKIEGEKTIHPPAVYRRVRVFYPFIQVGDEVRAALGGLEFTPAGRQTRARRRPKLPPDTKPDHFESWWWIDVVELLKHFYEHDRERHTVLMRWFAEKKLVPTKGDVILVNHDFCHEPHEWRRPTV